jgi:hypothetical protein
LLTGEVSQKKIPCLTRQGCARRTQTQAPYILRHLPLAQPERMTRRAVYENLKESECVQKYASPLPFDP